VNSKNFFFTILLVLFGIISSIIFCEILLRVKHSIIPNYDIEMWKYAKQLKIKVDDKNIGHVHKKNKKGVFQKVEIKINNFGQRDKDYDEELLKKFDKTFLIIGSSIPLGWGVERNKTFSNLLNEYSAKNKKKWIFINGGIGNHNTDRYVNNYLKNWSHLGFNNIIIMYFVNDTEILENKETNFFIKHTHLGVFLWKFYNSLNSSLKKENIESYYKNIYEKNYPGFIKTKQQLKNINNHCIKVKIKCTLVNMPDIHQLNPYKLNFINKKIEEFTKEINLRYIDLLPEFENVDETKVWNKYQDPHPNEFAHEIIANKIYNNLN
jgi:hypothetical protein